jgi:YVTN family beta-propeller protein
LRLFLIKLNDNKNMKKISILTLLLIGSISFAQSGYKISNKIHLDGDGSWDYLAVDNLTDRLFVSHSKLVQVLDLKEGKLIGTIPDTKGVHGIAIAKDLNKGYTSNGKDSSVTVFNLNNYDKILKIKVTGNKPDAILYDQFSHKIFVFNGKSNNATVIDANTDKVIETISLEGKPEYSVTNGKGKVYVNIETKNKIAVINSTTLKVEQSWSISPGEEPTGLAIDVKNNRLFSVCGNKLMIILDAISGKTITSLPVGEHCDGVVFDTETKTIYASNGEGTITVVKEENENLFKVIETIKTQSGAKTIALDAKSHKLYLPCAEYEKTTEPTTEDSKPVIKTNTFNVLVVESGK